MDKRKLTNAIVYIFLIFTALIIFNWSVIFQRGNPLPYMIRMVTLNSTNTYASVFADRNVYITRRNNHNELFRHIENTHNAKFAEQLGSGFMFDSAERRIIVVVQIYWRYFDVWEILE